MAQRANTAVALHPDGPVVAAIDLSYSTKVVELLGLPSKYENSASVVFHLYDTDGTTKLIDGLTCGYVTGSNGVYGGVSPGQSLTVDSEYKYEFVCTVAGYDPVTFRGYKTCEENPGT